MRRAILVIVSGVCVAAAILYATDFALVRFARSPFGTVIVTRYYVIPKKNGKTEFVFQPPELQRCVHSLLPQEGYTPCWYLSRHPEQPIKM